MSYREMNEVMDLDDLAPAEKLVMMGIARHNGPGGSWPSVGTLARYAGISDRHAQRVLRRLEARGFLVVEHQAGGTGSTRGDRRPNRYRLHLDGVTPTSPRDPSEVVHSGVTPMSPGEPNGVTSTTERGDIRDAHGVTPMSPEQVHEHVLEHAPPVATALQSTQVEPVEEGEGEGSIILEAAAAVCRWRHLNCGYPPAGPGAIRTARDELIAAGLDALATTWLTEGHDRARIISALVDRHTGTRPHAVPYTPIIEPERDPWVPPPGLYAEPGPDGLVPISAHLHALNRRRTA